jgi:hypothetical protein
MALHAKFVKIIGSSKYRRQIIGLCGMIAGLQFITACSSDQQSNLQMEEPTQQGDADGDAADGEPDPESAPAAAGNDGEDSAAEKALPPATEAPTADGRPTETIATPQAEKAPVAAGFSELRRVMYVKANKTALRASADKNAKAVGTLNRGDHILVNIEGEWARTDDGKYISMSQLSDKGIGRKAAKKAKWHSGKK